MKNDTLKTSPKCWLPGVQDWRNRLHKSPKWYWNDESAIIHLNHPKRPIAGLPLWTLFNSFFQRRIGKQFGAVNTPPPRIPVTTRIFTLLAGHPINLHLLLLLGGGPHPTPVSFSGWVATSRDGSVVMEKICLDLQKNWEKKVEQWRWKG